MADFEKAVQAITAEMKRLEAESRALKTKIEALTQTEAELRERVGDYMAKLEVVKQYEVVKAKARELLGVA